jgi:hypothetical protein
VRERDRQYDRVRDRQNDRDGEREREHERPREAWAAGSSHAAAPEWGGGAERERARHWAAHPGSDAPRERPREADRGWAAERGEGERQPPSRALERSPAPSWEPARGRDWDRERERPVERQPASAPLGWGHPQRPIAPQQPPPPRHAAPPHAPLALPSFAGAAMAAAVSEGLKRVAGIKREAEGEGGGERERGAEGEPGPPRQRVRLLGPLAAAAVSVEATAALARSSPVRSPPRREPRRDSPRQPPRELKHEPRAASPPLGPMARSAAAAPAAASAAGLAALDEPRSTAPPPMRAPKFVGSGGWASQPPPKRTRDGWPGGAPRAARGRYTAVRGEREDSGAASARHRGQDGAEEGEPRRTEPDRMEDQGGRDPSPSADGRDRSMSADGRDRSMSADGHDRSKSADGRGGGEGRGGSVDGGDASPGGEEAEANGEDECDDEGLTSAAEGPAGAQRRSGVRWMSCSAMAGGGSPQRLSPQQLRCGPRSGLGLGCSGSDAACEGPGYPLVLRLRGGGSGQGVRRAVRPTLGCGAVACSDSGQCPLAASLDDTRVEAHASTDCASEGAGMAKAWARGGSAGGGCTTYSSVACSLDTGPCGAGDGEEPRSPYGALRRDWAAAGAGACRQDDTRLNSAPAAPEGAGVLGGSTGMGGVAFRSPSRVPGMSAVAHDAVPASGPRGGAGEDVLPAAGSEDGDEERETPGGRGSVQPPADARGGAEDAGGGSARPSSGGGAAEPTEAAQVCAVGSSHRGQRRSRRACCATRICVA